MGYATGIDRTVFFRLVARLRPLSLDAAVGLLPLSVALLSVLVLLLLFVQRTVQEASPFSSSLGRWAMMALITSLALYRRSSAEPTKAGTTESGLKSYALALNVGVVLLIVPVFLAVWHTHYDDPMSWTYPFLNKRWLVALYLWLLGTSLLLPSAIDRLLREATVPPPPAAARSSTRMESLRWWLGLALTLTVVAFLFLPPWHIDLRHLKIDFHEQVHLGGLQAIDKGYVPYVGPASTQYGPGSQLLEYLFMKATGHFDIVSFREAQVALHVATFAAVCTLTYTLAGFWTTMLVVVLGIGFSPLMFFQFAGDRVINGWWGWGNSARYLGAVVTVLAAAAVLIRSKHTERIRSTIAIGALWGFCAWVSQENLSSTVLALGMLLSLLWATETVPPALIRRTCGHLAAGFAAIWLPLLVYYALHGVAGQFLHNYTTVPRAVAMGFSNTWWSEGPADRRAPAFYFTSLLVVVLGIGTLRDGAALRLRRALDRRQVLFLACVCTLAATYMTSLYRSDAAHLTNTLLPLPLVLALGFRDWPEWIARSGFGRTVVRIAFVAGALYLYPLADVVTNVYGTVFEGPWLHLVEHAPEPPPGVQDDPRIPFKRATKYLADEPLVADGSVPMRTFLEEATAVRELIGTRKTYVESFPTLYTGVIYFMLDLTPASYQYDQETLVINDEIRAEAYRYFRQHVRDVEAVVTRSTESREAQIFFVAHPEARIIPRKLAQYPYVVLIAQP